MMRMMMMIMKVLLPSFFFIPQCMQRPHTLASWQHKQAHRSTPHLPTWTHTGQRAPRHCSLKVQILFWRFRPSPFLPLACKFVSEKKCSQLMWLLKYTYNWLVYTYNWLVEVTVLGCMQFWSKAVECLTRSHVCGVPRTFIIFIINICNICTLLYNHKTD